jgi:drug/metabolite transporter (DMT)-like permease
MERAGLQSDGGIGEMAQATEITAAEAAPAPESSKSARSLGAMFALATAALLASQDPLSGPAARSLNAIQFLLVTELALVIAAPFLLWDATARGDFFKIVTSKQSVLRLAALAGIGLTGLALYNLGLRHAHPVVVSAILNLSPFWAALVARRVAGVRIPAGRAVFAISLAVAFSGSMLVAYSQMKDADLAGKSLTQILGQGSWYFAIPVPIFTSLSGTLVGLWFRDFRESASIAAALVAPAAALIPACLLYLLFLSHGFAGDMRAAGLLVAGAICASAIGRLCYQLALSKTGNDNGFVTMFFLLCPGLAALYSWLLSSWIESLRFQANASYFAGLAVTAGALFYFVKKSRAA